MTRKPNYPSDEWVEQWIDNYLDNATEKVTDFDAVRELAMGAWWENEIEHDRPTPFDLTPEQEKASKAVRKGMARSEKAVNAYGKEVKRTRKADLDKRKIVEIIGAALAEAGYEISITNVERQIDFGEYSVTLTKHRPKKG